MTYIAASYSINRSITWPIKSLQICICFLPAAVTQATDNWRKMTPFEHEIDRVLFRPVSSVNSITELVRY